MDLKRFLDGNNRMKVIVANAMMFWRGDRKVA